MPDPVVLYEERDDIAVLTLNRPDRLNTLTDQVVQGVADGIDAATASAAVRAVVLRGAGRALTAGYDLQGDPDATPVGPADPQYGSRRGVRGRLTRRTDGPVPHPWGRAVGVSAPATLTP